MITASDLCFLVSLCMWSVALGYWLSRWVDVGVEKAHQDRINK